MRIELSCIKCVQSNPNAHYAFVYPAEVKDDGLYHLECPNGHKTITCLQEQKFEILFEIAAYAIVDGYYREAVSSFTACLERFFEFYIKVICIKHGISEDLFNQNWKNVSNQSERQLGAFIFLYLLEARTNPILLSNKDTKFRNSVIHKGKIPTREEAIQYGESILDLVSPVLRDLKVNNADAVSKATILHISQTRKDVKGNDNIAFMTTPTTISVALGVNQPQQTLKETIERITSIRQSRAVIRHSEGT